MPAKKTTKATVAAKATPAKKTATSTPLKKGNVKPLKPTTVASDAAVNPDVE